MPFKPTTLRATLLIAGVLPALALGAVAIATRTVWLASIRPVVVLGGIAACTAVALFLACRMLLSTRPAVRSSRSVLLLAVWLAALAAFLVPEIRFRDTRREVLRAPTADLARVGRHVMVGYRDIDELQQLVRTGAVGGVFVTARNAAHLSARELATEIAGLQSLARASGHDPLIIATDQEGGMVSRLSPPLPKPRALSAVIAGTADAQERRRLVHEHAFDVGRQLAQAGVSLNFAPVADLDFGIRNPKDRHSRIGERAIASEADTVADVALSYCRGLLEAGVICTLKHFPGLGRVKSDTHVESATLQASVSSLATTDWQPFRAVLREVDAAVMMAHVVTPAVDRQLPASSSRAMITGILRQQWGYQGPVVTDDLTMIAATTGVAGIGAAGVNALNAGTDILLVAYDTDQVYLLIDALVSARKSGRLPDETLDASRRRLAIFTARRGGS